MINNKPSLKKEGQIISNLIKEKKVDLLINYYNSFDLSENIRNQCLNLLKQESKKNNSFFKISILIISNMSYQIFDRLIKEKFLVAKSLVNIEYIDYNNFLTFQDKKNMILFWYFLTKMSW